MSLPKEPRQLMINLMYLVLTAMLALNVSAEVINAFFDLNNSLKNSISKTNIESQSTWKGVLTALKTKKKLEAPILTAAEEMNESVDSLILFIDEIQARMIDEAGNRNGVVDEEDYLNGNPRGAKNKDVSNRILLNEGKGVTIKEDILALKKKLADTYRVCLEHPEVKKARSLSDLDIDQMVVAFESGLPLFIESEEEIQKKAKEGKELSWSEYKFKQMPLAAVLAILSKVQNDAEISRSVLTSKFAELTGGKNIKLNKFFPVIIPEKSYVIENEPFRAKVSIGAYSNEFSKSSTIYVNGKEVKLGSDGWGEFVETARGTGGKKLELRSKVINPHTNEKFEDTASFSYEVGNRSAAVSPTKMNVMYIGVKNPLNISVAGAPSSSVSVDCSGCKIKKSGDVYIAEVTRKGDVEVKVSAKDFPETKFKFRSKRIPDPLAAIGQSYNKHGGSIGNNEFKIHKELKAILKDFDFEATCNIASYKVTRVQKNKDPYTVANTSQKFNAKTKRMVSKAKPGDNYYFDEIKARCPGDEVGRRLPSIAFRIK